MAFDVTVTIDLTKAAASASGGLGMPLILVENCTTGSTVGYTKCGSPAEVITAGFAATTDAYKAAQLMFAQNNAPSEIAVCGCSEQAKTWLADAANAGTGWRQLIVLNGGDETAAASTPQEISTAVEALDGKMYFCDLDPKSDVTITTTDVKRTVVFYYTATDDVPAPVAALVGATAAKEPGSFTYKNQVLAGLAPLDLSASEIATIHSKGGMTFVEKAGDAVTTEGKTLGGEFIDIVDSEDYIIQNLTYKTQKALNTAEKIPYDNNGIALLESVAVDVLQTAYNNGMIGTTADGAPDYTVAYALREECADPDVSSRRYLGGEFEFALSGAIHEVKIHGVINA